MTSDRHLAHWVAEGSEATPGSEEDRDSVLRRLPRAKVERADTTQSQPKNVPELEQGSRSPTCPQPSPGPAECGHGLFPRARSKGTCGVRSRGWERVFARH